MNALPGPAGAANAAPAPATARRFDTKTIAVIAIALLLVFSLGRSLLHHESHEAFVAGKVTEGLQHDDVGAVKTFQNAETATQVTAALVGRAADALGPLGTLKSVQETAVDAATRTHQFDLSFDHGTVHETIRFDPDGKIVAFHYDPPIVK